MTKDENWRFFLVQWEFCLSKECAFGPDDHGINGSKFKPAEKSDDWLLVEDVFDQNLANI